MEGGGGDVIPVEMESAFSRRWPGIAAVGGGINTYRTPQPRCRRLGRSPPPLPIVSAFIRVHPRFLWVAFVRSFSDLRPSAVPRGRLA